MAWTQADLDAIDKAIANNVSSVTFADGRTTRYQDADKMLQVRNVIRAEVVSAGATAQGRVRTTYGRFRRR